MELLSLLLASLTTAIAAETEWPQFRGPTGQGHSLAKNLPIEWNATTNVAWKTPVPGSGWSSPVVSRGRIYLTAAVAPEGSTEVTLRALCFDAAKGTLVWDTEVFRPDPGSATTMHRKNTAASPTPIVTADRLFVHFGHLGTAALDLAGQVLWRQEELKYSPVHGTGGSPILVEGTLVFSCDGKAVPFIAALDAATGAIRWKTPRNSPAKKQFSFSTPLAIQLDGATQIISPGSGLVGSYDVKDGRERWRVAYGEGYSVVPRPVFAHGLLYLSSSFDKPVFHAIKPAGANGDATATHIAWTIPKGAPHTASAVVAGDEVFFVSDAGIATCADAKSGSVHWTERLGGNFSASPIVAEGHIYFQNEEGIGFVVKAAKTYELLATNDLAERTLASPAAIDGTLILRSEGHLWRIGK